MIDIKRDSLGDALGGDCKDKLATNMEQMQPPNLILKYLKATGKTNPFHRSIFLKKSIIDKTHK